MPKHGTIAQNNQDILDMYDEDFPAYHSWRDNVLDQTQYYSVDGAVVAKPSPINDLLELTQYYDYKGPTVQNLNGTFVGNPNATFSAGPLNSTFNAGILNSTFNAGHPNATFNAGPLNSTFNAGHPNATFNAGHPNATFNAGNLNSTFNAGHPNATFNAGNLNSTFIAGNPNATFNAGPLNSTFNAGHPNATFAVNNFNATFNAMSNKEDELATARETLLDNMDKQESLLQDVDDQLDLLRTEKKIVKRQAKDAMYTNMGLATASKQVNRRNYPHQALAEQFLRDKDYRRNLSFSNLDDTLQAVDETLEAADDTLEAVDEVLSGGSMMHQPNTSPYWRPKGVLVDESGLYDFPRSRPWYRAPRRYLSALGRNIPRAMRSNRVAPYDG